ncbi:MAG TPA: VWA domain-containing protein [Blastocatellia bacterium]|jgi:VWFA-related protein|nr:VWA domain-containing protein [Blastocatellia bacterium]
MKQKLVIAGSLLLLTGAVWGQEKQTKPVESETIKISTELVQLDAVVVDKDGNIVRGLSKDDFELYESGKKQHISFFEFVEAGKGAAGQAAAAQPRAEKPGISGQGLSDLDVRRTYAFVIDDLTIRPEDMTYVRELLNNFVDNQMQPTDLVAIIRVVGGGGLLQQFTADKELLRKAISRLTPSFNPFNVFSQSPGANGQQITASASQAPDPDTGTANFGGAFSDLSGNMVDITSAADDTNVTLRGYMTLGTASFVIESMRHIPGRKAMVLVSGGLPVLGVGNAGMASNVSFFLDVLADRATRAGVSINTMDIRGLSAQVGVARFEDTPGRSALGGGSNTNTSTLSRTANGSASTFGQTADETMLGYNQPIDVTSAYMGLRQLSSATGGLAVLNRNDFKAGLAKIIASNDGYYLLAYSPADAKFNGEFRKVEIKVRGGYKVLSRRGYVAREMKPAAAPTTKREQLLAAIQSPLARRDIDMDAALLYKGKPDGGDIDVQVLVDPRKLAFTQAGEQRMANYDVSGFVFDQVGKQRGGFDNTVNVTLTADEYNRALKSGLPYLDQVSLPPGIYQVRIAVRDNTNDAIGTISRYLEVPDLAKGRLAVSSVLLGSVAAGETRATSPTPLSATRQIQQKNDLRYAAIVYNARDKGGQIEVTTQLLISQNGQVIYKGAEEPVLSGGQGKQLIKVGQLGLSHVRPGRYTATVVVTDNLADKKARTVSRSMDFTVVP